MREFCDEHSSQRADIKTMKLTTARVCDYCHAHLSGPTRPEPFILTFINITKGGDEHCASRLVPYLLEDDVAKKEKALTELASLLYQGSLSHHFNPILISLYIR